MRAFRFPLERVLEVRRAQLRMEEARLEQLVAGLRAIQARQAGVLEAYAAAREGVVGAPAAMGAEFAALAGYREASERESARLAAERATINQRIAAQMEHVTRARRNARLLEKLRERKLAEWSTAFAREAEQQAEEAFLARWNRSQ